MADELNPATPPTPQPEDSDQNQVTDPGNGLSTLPSEENTKTTGTVNWLGSSYSGADIKVVAHLYKEEDSTSLENYYDQLVRSSQAITDACSSALLAVNTSLFDDPAAENTMLVLGGVFPPNQDNVEAGRILLTILHQATRSLGPDAFVQDMTNSLGITAQQYSDLAGQYTDKLATIKNNQNKATTTIVLGTLQTISVQTHREKFPVRGFGQSYVKGYTRGPRTIAGSMIFTVFDEHALAELIRSMADAKSSIYGEQDTELSTLIADQLPPIDLTIVFANEYGSLSQMAIYGVEFVNDGVTMSIEDMITEEVVNFVARDTDVMTRKENVLLSRQQRGMHSNDDGKDTTGTDLLFSGRDAYNAYLDKLGVRRRLSNR